MIKLYKWVIFHVLIYQRVYYIPIHPYSIVINYPGLIQGKGYGTKASWESSVCVRNWAI